MSVTPSYERRRPEDTALYRAVSDGLEEFLAMAKAHDQQVPWFVEQEFRRYLSCGRLEEGFVRIRCRKCRYERLVAFSCKGRGFCPSCCGRRMGSIATRLVDHVLPDVPYRQWVLSLPPPLRYFLAYDSQLLSQVIRYFINAIFSWQRRQAKVRYGLSRLSQAHPGAVVGIQRFGSSLNLNIHPHAIAMDGVYVREGEKLRFLRLGKPTEGEVRAIAWETCQRTLQLLRRQGRWLDEDTGPDGEDTLKLEEPLLADIYGASIRGILALGPRAGKRVLTFASHLPRERKQRPPAALGFDVDANVTVRKGNRRALERLCRYLCRPPAGVDRFEAMGDGRIAVRFKRPWSDGTSHIVLTPVELVEKLAALVPPPKVNMTRYFGVFAARSKLKRRIRPKPPANEGQVQPGCGGHGYRIPWEQLLKRTFDYQVMSCPRCNSQMQRISVIHDRQAIDKILAAVGYAADSPKAA